MRAAKICFYKAEFSQTKSNPKMTWKFINKLTGTIKNDKWDYKNTLYTNGQKFNSLKNSFKAANLLNTFLLVFGEEYTKSFKIIPIKFNNKICNSFFNEFFLKKSDVVNIINSFKDETSAGFNKILVKILKQISEYIIYLLTYLFNLCLKQGIFLEKFKLAIVRPYIKQKMKRMCQTIDQYSWLPFFKNVRKNCKK